MVRKNPWVRWVVVFVGVLAAVPALAQPVGTAFTYQGRLQDNGTPASGAYDLRFTLYDAAVGGAQVGPIVTANDVAVISGLFTVTLDFGAVFTGNKRFLEVAVRPGASTGAYTPLAARQEVTPTPNAVNSSALGGQAPTYYTDLANHTGTLPDARLSANIPRLDAANTFSAAQSISGGAQTPLWLSSSHVGGTWLNVINSSTGGHTWNLISTGQGNGEGVGKLLFRDETGGALPLVLAGGNVGIGTTSPVARLDVQVADAGAIGVSGLASAATGLSYGGQFRSNSTSGRGVYGEATATTGSVVGVWGKTASPNGRGVYGENVAGTGVTYGGRFEVASGSGRAVFGWASAATSGYGVFGDSNGYGVFSAGTMAASGAKLFRIDHPDDPENRYLLHYSAESPDVINFYSDTATLDDRGEAVIELPHYFAKINTKPRYQLTAVGAPMPMLHVAKKISDAALSAGARAEPDEAAPVCSFRIAGGAPGGEVSWEVKAVRNDRWVQKRGAPVEVEKEGPEKGTYQHPDLYGQPPEKGMLYDATRERSEPVAGTAPR